MTETDASRTTSDRTERDRPAISLREVHMTALLILILAAQPLEEPPPEPAFGLLHIAPASSEAEAPDWVPMLEPTLGETLYVAPDPVLSEEHVAYAHVVHDGNGLRVDLLLTPLGMALLGEMTTARVGERIAIVAYAELMSAPVVMEPVTGGRAAITGPMTRDFAGGLAEALND